MQPQGRARAVPMEVLVLGLCRSGTMSMSFALNELGYGNVYHFFELYEHESHAEWWISAVKSKYEPLGGNSNDFTVTDWDQVLGEYGAVTDIPTACFAPELIAAYPEAKIILTTRSASSWQTSMLRTIHALQSSYVNRILVLVSSSQSKALSRLMDLIILYYFKGDIPLHGAKVFEEHNEMVKRIAQEQKRELLEFRTGDGWESLCAFLGKEVPDIDYPHVNDATSWRRSFGLENSGWSLKFWLVVGSMIVAGTCVVYMM